MSSVQATGDFAADTKTGQRYAELAVAYARSKNSAIGLVLSDINIKTFIGETPLNGIEYRFFSRIALSMPRVEIGANLTA